MIINRLHLERIVNEELIRMGNRTVRPLAEAPGLGSPLDDLEDAPPPTDEIGGGPPREATGEKTGDDDPMDDELDAMVAGEEPDEDEGSVAEQMKGKVISSIEHERESESIPGAQEVIVAFEDVEDKLRIILTPTGNVKFFWKGLHNDIGSADDIPPEEIEAEEEERAGDDEELDTESTPLPTEDGGIEEPEI